MATDPILKQLAEGPESEVAMPALFIGHGSPMNAIESTEYNRAWAEVARALPRPKAVLCISAHWQTAGTRVTAMERPRTIHDFHGFPSALFAKQYPAPGSPELARAAQEVLRDTEVALDGEWGLDHGAWSVLCQMYPEADIPVVQLSLDERRAAASHYELGRELRSLRRKGVLIIGSGNIVHNLRQVIWTDTAYDWALEFDAKIKELILSGEHQAIVDYSKLGRSARLAVPTLDHYLPLLYVLGVQEKGEGVGFFADKVTLGAISMRSVRVG